MMKTNKSYSKRLKITGRGKILARRGGQNHFNAKERRSQQLTAKQWKPISLKPKALSRFLPSHF